MSMIDMLLDQYNDFMTLFRMFGDAEYKAKAQNILLNLTIMV
jgi:hypothetical protein